MKRCPWCGDVVYDYHTDIFLDADRTLWHLSCVRDALAHALMLKRGLLNAKDKAGA